MKFKSQMNSNLEANLTSYAFCLSDAISNGYSHTKTSLYYLGFSESNFDRILPEILTWAEVLASPKEFLAVQV